MATYTLTIGQRRIPIAAKTFWTLLLVFGLPSLALFIFLFYLIWLGLFTLGGWLLVLLTVFVLGHATFTTTSGNVHKFAVVQNDVVRNALSALVNVSAGVYGFIVWIR